MWPRARGSGRGRCPDEAELALTEAGGLRAWRRGTASVWDTDGVWSQQPPGCRVESGSRLDNDYIDYLTRVMFYAKRADKTLEQVLSDLRDRNCTQEALDYVVAHW